MQTKERERESYHIFLWENSWKKKKTLPYGGDKRKNYKPNKRRKKKPQRERERERVIISCVRNMDQMRDNSLFRVKKIG